MPDPEGPKLYIALISIHGLIRGRDLELGRDADTGGQTLYVVELARALGEHERVAQVDLVTRLVDDPEVSDDYAQPVELLADNVRIVRIEAGPAEYLPKEQLWDHLDSFMDNLVLWLNEQPRMPNIVHGHYADAGYVGLRLANLLGAPLVFTGHSLGRDKRKRLLASGLTAADIEQTYNISRRIAAEEETLAHADLVITSTHNEIEAQYGLYDYYEPDRMEVVPPGTNLQRYNPPEPGDRYAFEATLEPFLRDPGKPLVFALSRPDERKNVPMLVKAFGLSKRLRDVANLLIIAGNREDITDLDAGAEKVLTTLLLLIDRYDLYGHVAIPKQVTIDEVPDIYRMTAVSRGVFVNPALTEPFGLTLLEAAACGLPIVATENGGPVDIIGNCDNGLLVDPLDPEAIADALLALLEDPDQWAACSHSGIEGVRRHYTWPTHARRYVDKLLTLTLAVKGIDLPPAAIPARYQDRAIFTDLDLSLLGDVQALQRFSELIRKHHKRVIFGIVTGRRIDSALSVMRRHRLPPPDVLISSIGTRIHYGRSLDEDRQWTDHIDHDWNRRRIIRVLSGVPGLKPQARTEQSEFKLSYFHDPEAAPPIDEIITLLHQNEITANVISAFGQYLDILPARASKGRALRYAALRLDIPMEHILVAGGSGADEDMIRGNAMAVVVANRHEEELAQLDDADRIYFAEQPHAAGILEAIEYYDFLSAGNPG